MEIIYENIIVPIKEIIVGKLTIKIAKKYFEGRGGIKITNNSQEQHFGIPWEDVDNIIEALQILKKQDYLEKQDGN